MDNYYTSITLLVNQNQYNYNSSLLDKYASFIDFTREYSIDTDLFVVEIETLDGTKNAKELFEFVFNNFQFIVIHQEGSRCLISKDGEGLKKVLSNSYGKERRIYFLYDMLTIEERYKCIEKNYGDLTMNSHLIVDNNGVIYSLFLHSGCMYLFKDDPVATIENDVTGEKKEIDISTEMLKIYKFSIIILK